MKSRKQKAESRNRALVISAFCFLISDLTFAADQNALHAAGPQAARLTNLWWIFFWVCAAFYIVMMIFFVAAWIRGRRNIEPDLTPGTDRSLGIAVSAALIICVIGLLALLVTSIAAGRAVGTFASNRPNQLEID